MTAIFIHDAYTDKPRTPRTALEERIRQLKCTSWAYPGDHEVSEQIAQLEAELHALDHAGAGSAS